MAALTKTNFEAITDSLGEQYAKFKALADVSAATDLETGALNNLNRIDALADKRAQADLMTSFLDAQEGIAAGTYLAARNVWGTLLGRLQRNITNINTFCAAQSAKVSKNFADLCLACGITVAPAHVYHQAEITVATETVTAANTGTFAAASTIDPATFSPSRMHARVTANVTVGFTLNCTMRKADLTTEVKAVVIPASSVAGAEVAVGLATDLYLDCTAIAVVGGGANDGAVAIVAKVLRVAAL